MPMTTTPARRWLLAVVAAGLILRVCVLPWTTGLGASIEDEHQYLRLATSLVEGRGFSTDSGPTSLRPPLYPAMIAATWHVTGSRSLQAVRVVQIALAVALTLVIFAVGRDLFGERAGVAAAAVTCLYPSLFASTFFILTEVLFAALTAAAVWAAIRTFQRGSRWAALCAGLSIGLAALTRSVVYPLPVLLGVWVMASHPARFRDRLVLAVLLVAGAAAAIGPWAVRNTRLQGVPVLVDTMGGMNLRMGNYEHTPHERIWDAVSMTGSRNWVSGLPEPPDGPTFTEGQKERWAREQAVAFMLAHPGLTLWRAAIKFGDFWALERDFIAGVQKGLFRPPAAIAVAAGVLILISYPLTLVLAIFGLGYLGRVNCPAAWLPLAVTLFVCALHSVVFGHPRYRLPLMPLVGVYAAAALTGGLAQTAASWRHRAVPMALTAGFVLMWLVQFVWRDWPRVARLVATGAWGWP